MGTAGDQMATITLSDDLMARLKSLADDAGEPVEAVVESLLEDLVAHVGFERKLPVLRVPPGTPPLTVEEVNRVLNGTDE